MGMKISKLARPGGGMAAAGGTAIVLTILLAVRCAVKKLGGGPGAMRGSNLPGCPIVLLTLVYSVFRLVLDALIDRRRSDASLRLELLVLRHQLRVLERQVKRPRWRSADRLTLAGLSRRLARTRWFCFLVSPQTLLRWHRDLVRRRWALFARRPRHGRPGLAAERRQLILRLARENSRWG